MSARASTPFGLLPYNPPHLARPNRLTNVLRPLVPSRPRYTEAIECWQRLALITLPLGLSAGTTKGLFLALGVCLASTGAVTYCAPYASVTDNRISAVANWALVAMLSWSFALRLDGDLGLGLGLAGGAGDDWALGGVVVALEALVAIIFLASCRAAATAANDSDADDVSGLFLAINGSSSSSSGGAGVEPAATVATTYANSTANTEAGSSHLVGASSAEGQANVYGYGRKRLATARTAGVGAGAGDGKSPWERQRDAEVEKRERERVRKLEVNAQQLAKENENLRAELAALNKVSRDYRRWTVDGGGWRIWRMEDGGLRMEDGGWRMDGSARAQLPVFY